MNGLVVVQNFDCSRALFMKIQDGMACAPELAR